MSKLLSELAFGAFLAYSPNGPPEVEPHRSSQRLRAAIKTDSIYRGAPAIDLAVGRMAEVRDAQLAQLFGSDVVLVPAPRSAPFPEGLSIPLRGSHKDFLWVPRRICETLVAAGLAGGWRPLLRREHRVIRSASALPGNRPLPFAHYESLSCVSELVPSERYLVVDDVVTRGSTLLACASRLSQAYPQAEVQGFALLRTVSNPAEFTGILDPVVGEVSLRSQGDTLRRP